MNPATIDLKKKAKKKMPLVLNKKICLGSI